MPNFLTKLLRKPKPPEMGEIATSRNDPDLFTGDLDILSNPDKLLEKKGSSVGISLYDEIDADPHAGSVLQTRYLSVVGREWNVEPASDSPEDQRIADYVREVLLNFNFDQARHEILQAILYGFFVGEIMWERSEGDVWIKKIFGKHPRRFFFTHDRELRLLTQKDMTEGEAVPDRKFMTFTYGSSDNPYGKGLGQRLWWPVWFKKHGIKFWMIFAEKFGAPTPWGKYPAGTKKDKQDDLLAALNAMQKDNAIITPDNMVVELLEASRQSSVNTYESLCKFMNSQMSKTVLGQTLTTEIGEKGSYAAGKVHEDVRQDIVKADADLFSEMMNNTLIRWIVVYNFPGVTVFPKFWIRTDHEKDLKPLAERDKILIKDIGVKVGGEYFYSAYNIPRPEEGEELVVPPTSPIPGPPTQFAEKKTLKGDDAQKFVDSEIDKKVQTAIPIFGKWNKKLLGAINNASDYSALLARIDDIGRGFKVDDLAELLAFGMADTDQIGVDSVMAEIEPLTLPEFAEHEALWGPGLPFKEALDFFRAKTFKLADIAKDDLLEAVKDEITRAMVDGIALQEFKKTASEIFDRHGYSDVGDFRIETIFRTNMQTAYQAGRHRQMTDDAVMKARPYWRYVAVQDTATRPEHMAMHGKVFPADHPIWDVWYPPNGFNCRCYIQTVSTRGLARRKWKVETTDPTGTLFEPVDFVTKQKLPARLLMPDKGWDKLPVAM